MADYTWKQWDAEQNDANLLHASDCERWQAGIELAGGSWDGSWTDLDTSGKGLITIDQFNALESQIQSKVSSYTPKNYDPDSTVQIVPGPDGWNKLEDGILKAVCTPDNASGQNMLKGTRDFTGCSSGNTTLTGETYEGCAVRENVGTGSMAEGVVYTGISVDPDTDYTLSFWAKATREFQYYFSNVSPVPVSLVTSQGGTATNTSNITISEMDDWERIWVTAHTSESMPAGSSLSLYLGRIGRGGSGGTVWLAGLKLEKGATATNWSPAPQDYGYPDTTTLSATPQSVEDSDEIPAVEAGEIE